MAEQSHFLEYQNQKFKYRPDVKTSKKLVDWKKTRLEFPKPEKWEREIIKYNYHISAAFYQFFEHEITGKWKSFYWIVQEEAPPFDFLIHNSSDWGFRVNQSGEIDMGFGAIQFIKLLEQWIYCAERNEWPGYSAFIQPDWKDYRIAETEVPGYYMKKDINFYND